MAQHPHDRDTLPLPLCVSHFPLSICPSSSSSLEFWNICTHFPRLPSCFQRNPFRLGRAKAKCGWILLWGVTQGVLSQCVCVGSDLWPFFKLTTGHRPSSPHAKTNGLSSKLNVTFALCVLLFSFVIRAILILDLKDNFSFDFVNYFFSSQRLTGTAEKIGMGLSWAINI